MSGVRTRTRLNRAATVRAWEKIKRIVRATRVALSRMRVAAIENRFFLRLVRERKHSQTVSTALSSFQELRDERRSDRHSGERRNPAGCPIHSAAMGGVAMIGVRRVSNTQANSGSIIANPPFASQRMGHPPAARHRLPTSNGGPLALRSRLVNAGVKRGQIIGSPTSKDVGHPQKVIIGSPTSKDVGHPQKVIIGSPTRRFKPCDNSELTAL